MKTEQQCMYYSVSEWLLFNAKWAIFQLYHGERKDLFGEMMMVSALYYTNMLSWIFRYIAPLGHIILIRANHSLLLLLNAACLAEKYQIQILKSSIRPDRGSNHDL